MPTSRPAAPGPGPAAPPPECARDAPRRKEQPVEGQHEQERRYREYASQYPDPDAHARAYAIHQQARKHGYKKRTAAELRDHEEEQKQRDIADLALDADTDHIAADNLHRSSISAGSEQIGRYRAAGGHPSNGSSSTRPATNTKGHKDRSIDVEAAKILGLPEPEPPEQEERHRRQQEQLQTAQFVAGLRRAVDKHIAERTPVARNYDLPNSAYNSTAKALADYHGHPPYESATFGTSESHMADNLEHHARLYEIAHIQERTEQIRKDNGSTTFTSRAVLARRNADAAQDDQRRE